MKINIEEEKITKQIESLIKNYENQLRKHKSEI